MRFLRFGRQAAQESINEIKEYIKGCDMLFIAAGMGGGTGTGAAPIIANIAKEMGILTVCVVTKPFHFEGSHRMKIAELGVQELYKYADTVITIKNQNLFLLVNERTTVQEAFEMADEVLCSGVRGLSDLVVIPGLINLDFADIKSVMSEHGKAMMGTGIAEGEDKAVNAAKQAITNVLMDDLLINGAKAMLINVTGGEDMTLCEVDAAVQCMKDEVDTDANIIFGSMIDSNMAGKIRVTLFATGIENEISKKNVIKKRRAALHTKQRDIFVAQSDGVDPESEIYDYKNDEYEADSGGEEKKKENAMELGLLAASSDTRGKDMSIFGDGGLSGLDIPAFLRRKNKK